MKPLTIADSASIILGLHDEIRRSEESRYDHRLHGVLLVAQGMSQPLPQSEDVVVCVWTPDAEARLKKAPFFVRRMIRAAVEAYARRQGAATVTPAILDEARQILRPR